MFKALFPITAVIMLLAGCSTQPASVPTLVDSPLNKSAIISFGSCLRQWADQPVWQAIAALQSEAFIFTGDNVYNDVGPYLKQQEPQRIQQAYRDLSLSTQFATFLRTAKQSGTGIYATWDDHDYGLNDGGEEYPFKSQAKQYFSEFFQLNPADIGDSVQTGVYHSAYIQAAGLRVQMIMLDTRSYRSALLRKDRSMCSPTGIVANTSEQATILGEAQWQWLATELQEPADIRLLVSSIQILPSEHCFEKWSNFPRERARLLALLANSRANGLVLISGDRHLAEISRLQTDGMYPLYEITSSGLNSAVGVQSPAADEVNSLRLTRHNILIDNFGSIEIERKHAATVLVLQLRDRKGNIIQQERVPLAVLK